MKLNRDQIVKALECCIKNQCENCCQCGNWHEQWNCMTFLMKNALSLIKELTEENDRLKLDVEVCGAELSRYTENIVQMAKQDRADTVRKMHAEIKERCIKGCIYPAFVARTIDQIEKEMMEGKDENT